MGNGRRETIMKAEMRMALGLGAGYLLGRSGKLRWTWLLAAAAASGRLGDTGQLVRRKAGSVPGSSAIGEIAGDIPGRLVEAGKAAAVTAATARMDSLVDKLHSQTEALRRPAVPSVGSEDEAPGKGGRSSTADRPQDDEYDDEFDDESRESEDPGEPAARRRVASGTRRGTPSRRSARDEEQDEGSDDGDFDDDDSDKEAEDNETSGAEARSERDRDRRPRTRGSAEPRTRDIDDDSERRPRKRSSSDRGDAPIRRTRR
jgi:hypothetical protein